MRRNAFAWGATLLLAGVAAALFIHPISDRVACGPGFDVVGPRCMPRGCPAPLAAIDGVCVAKLRVAVPETKLTVGPSDWEAEGRVTPHIVVAGPFWIDAFEATQADFAGHGVPDALRAASAITRDEAATYCVKGGGRLPTEDEWTVAGAGLAGHRYPWGETGAVCRRAAFGLVHGPCFFRGVGVATGPDTVGAHIDGDSAHGIHDLAGNVAEWVAPGSDPRFGVAKGGSWRSELAGELRVWARLEVDPSARDDRVGVRCAYDAP